jgi:SAM-dependent methyltransferase
MPIINAKDDLGERKGELAMMNKKAARKVPVLNGVLFPEMAINGTSRGKSTYDPLPSVWEGSDAELLERMLSFYPKKKPEKILDATVNAGRFWVGTMRKIVGMDIDRHHKPDVVGDNTDMPFDDESFDVIVYDPPHIPNQGADRDKDFNKRFGLGPRASLQQGYNFSHMFPPFCMEAHRVLKKNGVLFCKIADYVHGHRFQWAHVELLNAAVGVGFTACDCIVKVRKGPITDPRWKKAHHARRHHCYWLVFRKSKKCE